MQRRSFGARQLHGLQGLVEYVFRTRLDEQSTPGRVVVGVATIVGLALLDQLLEAAASFRELALMLLRARQAAEQLGALEAASLSCVCGLARLVLEPFEAPERPQRVELLSPRAARAGVHGEQFFGRAQL